MNPNIKYEIKARAFLLQTSLHAPGKDVVGGGASQEERQHRWDGWIRTHGTCIDAMLAAFEEILHDRNDPTPP